VDPATPPQATVVWTGGDAAIVHLVWRPVGEMDDRVMFQVLRFQDDRIREMADYRTIGDATQMARRFAAQAAD
jgi:hypothetical protein